MGTKNLRIHRSIDEINRNQWNNVVEHSDRGTIFHRAEWLRAVEEGLGRSARHLVVEKNGNPVGVFPHFIVRIDLPDFVPASLDGVELKRLSSTDPGFGGPLFVGDERSNFEAVFNHVDRLFSDTNAIQHLLTPSDADFVRYNSQLGDHGYRPMVAGCRFITDLRRGWDAIESNMDRSKRSNLKSARQSSATVEQRSLDDSALERFYGTYVKAMDRVGGKTYSYEFFEALKRELADRSKLFTVYVDGEFAGGQLYLLDENRSIIREFFRGLDAEYFDHNLTELVCERAMNWGIEHGYDEYDFGMTSPDFTAGSFVFKNEFGGDIRPVLAWERGCSPVGWQIYRVGRWLVRNRDRLVR